MKSSFRNERQRRSVLGQSSLKQRLIAQSLVRQNFKKKGESESMSNSGLYRSRDGLVFGVCKGIADSRGFSVTVTRIFALAIMIFSWVVPFLIGYIALAIFLKQAPAPRFDNWDEEKFDDTLAYSRGAALKSLKSSFDRLNDRIRNMESRVTDKDFDWDERLKSS
jgi:phage shock protein C